MKPFIPLLVIVTLFFKIKEILAQDFLIEDITDGGRITVVFSGGGLQGVDDFFILVEKLIQVSDLFRGHAVY